MLCSGQICVLSNCTSLVNASLKNSLKWWFVLCYLVWYFRGNCYYLKKRINPLAGVSAWSCNWAFIFTLFKTVCCHNTQHWYLVLWPRKMMVLLYGFTRVFQNKIVSKGSARCGTIIQEATLCPFVLLCVCSEAFVWFYIFFELTKRQSQIIVTHSLACFVSLVKFVPGGRNNYT